MLSAQHSVYPPLNHYLPIPLPVRNIFDSSHWLGSTGRLRTTSARSLMSEVIKRAPRFDHSIRLAATL